MFFVYVFNVILRGHFYNNERKNIYIYNGGWGEGEKGNYRGLREPILPFKLSGI